MSKYRYKCTKPMLPPDAESPVMDNRQMEDWLNGMSNEGWDFVGYAQKEWQGNEPFTQDWWIFRKGDTDEDA